MDIKVGLLLSEGQCSRFPVCRAGGNAVAENRVSGIKQLGFKLPAEYNKNNYHLLSTYYVLGTVLNAYMHYFIKSSQSHKGGAVIRPNWARGALSNLPRPKAV